MNSEKNRKEQRGTVLIVFTRYPEPGKTKTRMIPALGAYGAARLQREMTRHILGVASSVGKNTAIRIFSTGGDVSAIRALYGNIFTVKKQSLGDLGARMLGAFRSVFSEGFSRAVIIGSDCPSIDVPLLRKAFTSLKNSDCVIGPAYDGGYYLIGMKKPLAPLFKNIEWGTDAVLKQTLCRAEDSVIPISLLDKKADIDVPKDLVVWREAITAAVPFISVIIPALNEEANIAKTIQRVLSGKNIECIVADGGSNDATVRIAKQNGARVIVSEKGRSRQMNSGAEDASSPILLFLHADTLLPLGYDDFIRSSLSDPKVSVGTFSLSFDEKGFMYTVIRSSAQLRVRLFGLPYGDQGYYMWADDFYAAGEFPDIKILEDAAILRKLKTAGRIKILPDRVVTSARRYKKNGTLSACFSNMSAIFCFLMGADPDDIYRVYNTGGFRSWAGLLWKSIILKISLRKAAA